MSRSSLTCTCPGSGRHCDVRVVLRTRQHHRQLNRICYAFATTPSALTQTRDTESRNYVEPIMASYRWNKNIQVFNPLARVLQNQLKNGGVKCHGVGYDLRSRGPYPEICRVLVVG